MPYFSLSRRRAASRLALAISLGVAVIGCGDDDDSPTDPGEFTLSPGVARDMFIGSDNANRISASARLI